MARSGSIPDEITFVYSHGEERAGDLVVPAFVVDSSNPNTMQTAEEWAGRARYVNRNKVTSEIQKRTRPNKPFTDPVINTLEHRGQGGRAWKTIVDNDFYVDLREYELLWVILNKGVRPGGVLNGEFVFGMAGSQMKLIPVGSPIYEDLLESTKLKKKKKLSNKELKAGHVYRDRDKHEYIFLGWISHYDFQTAMQQDHNTFGFRRGTQKYFLDKITKKKTKHGLWFEKRYYNNESPLEVLKQGKFITSFSFQKTKTVYDDCGEYEKLNEADLLTIKTEAEKMFKNKFPTSWHMDKICIWQLAHMVPYGEDLPELDKNLIREGMTIV